jgi:hypothetical protein
MPTGTLFTIERNPSLTAQSICLLVVIPVDRVVWSSVVDEIDSNSLLFDDLDDKSLYVMLGNAWYAQVIPRGDLAIFLCSPEEMGRTTFADLRSALKDGLAGSSESDLVARVNRVISSCATWKMPVTVVAALAKRQSG